MPIETAAGTIIDPVQKAQVFVNHFTQTSKDIQINKDSMYELVLLRAQVEQEDQQYNRLISMNELVNAIKKAKNTSPGKDKITNDMLKQLPEKCLKELLSIYNKSIIDGEFPNEWKNGIILPITKPQKPLELLTSCRAINLLACMGKTMERII